MARCPNASGEGGLRVLESPVKFSVGIPLLTDLQQAMGLQATRVSFACVCVCV